MEPFIKTDKEICKVDFDGANSQFIHVIIPLSYTDCVKSNLSSESDLEEA